MLGLLLAELLAVVTPGLLSADLQVALTEGHGVDAGDSP